VVVLAARRARARSSRPHRALQDSCDSRYGPSVRGLRVRNQVERTVRLRQPWHIGLSIGHNAAAVAAPVRLRRFGGAGLAEKKKEERRARQELRSAAPRDRAVLGRQRLSAKTEQMRSCARMSARGWPKLRRGRGGRGVAHRIGVPPVRLFGGRILPPAVFRRCCRALCRSRARYFWRRSESASAASTRRRCDSLAPRHSRASCCWSWASIAARPPDPPESSALLTRVDSGYCP